MTQLQAYYIDLNWDKIHTKYCFVHSGCGVCLTNLVVVSSGKIGDGFDETDYYSIQGEPIQGEGGLDRDELVLIIFAISWLKGNEL